MNLISFYSGLSDFAPRWISSVAWPLLWQSSLLAITLFLLDMALHRRARPAIRYALWLVLLLKLLMPPSLALPTSAAWWIRSPNIAPATLRTTSVTVTYGPFVAPPSETLPTMTPAPSTYRLSVSVCAILAWAVGSVLLLGWMLMRWRQVWRAAHQAESAPEWLRGLLSEARSQTCVRRRVDIRLTPQALSPAVCGFFRPVILLSHSLVAELTPAQLRAVLVHELIHVRRRDVWLNGVQALLQAAYWWHPLLWLANGRIRRLREEAVDDAVMLVLNDDAETYAPTLLHVAKLALLRPLTSLGLVGIFESKSALRARIQRLVNFSPSRKAGLTWLAFLGIGAFALVVLPMGKGQGRALAGQLATSGNSSQWPDPRFSGYKELQLQARFFLVDEASLHLIASVSGSYVSALDSNQLARVTADLSQTGASEVPGRGPLQFETFSGGEFFWAIGGGTNNEVRYQTRTEQGQTVVTGAEAMVGTGHVDWEPLELWIVPWQENGFIRCEATLRPTGPATELTIPSGGGALWLKPEPMASGKYQLVLLQNPVQPPVQSGQPDNPSLGVSREAQIQSSYLVTEGRLLFESNRFDEATVKLNKALLLNSNNPAAHFYLGMIEGARMNDKAKEKSGRAPTSAVSHGVLGANIGPGKAQSSTNRVPPLYTRIIKVEPKALLDAAFPGASGVPLPEGAQLQKGLLRFFAQAGADLAVPETVFLNTNANTLLVRASMENLSIIERTLASLLGKPGQIQIAVKFIEVPKDWELPLPFSTWAQLGAENSGNPPGQAALTPVQAKVVWKAIESNPNASVFDAASVITLSGRETSIEVVEMKTVLSGIDPKALTPPGISGTGAAYVTTNMAFGPKLTMIAYALTNGTDIELTPTGSMYEFLGYDKPATNTPVYVGGRKLLSTMPLPHVRIRYIDVSPATVTIHSGYTLVLGSTPLAKSGMPAEASDIPVLSRMKRLLVLITPTLVDPAGNPVSN